MGDSEPPDTSEGDRPENSDEVCEYCGSEIDTSEWYPATTERDPDGELQLYAFCDESCKDAWLDERAE